jgi:hypothetical protein
VLLLPQLSAAGIEVGSLRGEVGQLVSLKEAAEQDMARISADLAAVRGRCCVLDAVLCYAMHSRALPCICMSRVKACGWAAALSASVTK